MIEWFEIHYQALSYLSCCAILCMLAFFSFWRRMPFGTSFALLCFCMAFWTGGIGVNYIIYPEPYLERWFTFYYIGISFTPVAFLYFSMHFLKLRSSFLLMFFSLLFVLSTFFSIFIMVAPDFIISLEKNGFAHLPRYGRSGYFFIAYLAFAIFTILLLWIKKIQTEKDNLQKRRIVIILFSFLFSLIAFVDSLPGLGFHIYPLGHIILTAIMTFQAYVLFVYRVVKIQNTLSRLWQHFIIISLITIPWIIILYLFIIYKFISSWQTAWIFSLFGFLSFIPYYNFSTQYLSHHLFKSDHIFIDQIHFFADKIISLQDPENLMVLIENVLVKVLGVKKICIVYKTTIGKSFLFRAIPGPDNVLPDSIHDILQWFKKHPSIIFKEDIHYEPSYYAVQSNLQKIFYELNISTIVPIVQNQELLGIIFLETGRLPKSWEFRFLTQLQPYLIVAMNNSLLYDNIHHLNVDLENVNRHLNEEVDKRRQELEAALLHMKQLHLGQSNFFNMASHHLRTPLTSIRASATLLWAKNPQSHKMGLNAILNDNIERLDNLINNIIEIAKIENGSISLVQESVPIHQIIINAYLENEMLFPHKSLAWHFDLSSGPKTIQGDCKRLQTVLSNLFSNAFKFTPQNGSISVRWAPVSNERLIKYKIPNDAKEIHYNEFIISDNGDGIPEDEMKIIFDIFKQVKGSHKRYQGPGLGLFLVKSIIENHKGAIFLESKIHEGSHFSFLLPMLC